MFVSQAATYESIYTAYDGYQEGELARLVFIIVTPDPVTGVRSTSANADRHTYLKELAKDTLICALDALAQSSDAFSPLKSVAGGLMFLVNQAEASRLRA